MTLPNENEKRFVAILNRKIETGKLMNALGHCTAGLTGSTKDQKDLYLLAYADKTDGPHGKISHYPFIILKAENSNEIRKVRQECIHRNIPFSDFTHTMTLGTSKEQINATKSTEEADLEYYAIVLFGPTEEVKQFTKKFSLFK